MLYKKTRNRFQFFFILLGISIICKAQNKVGSNIDISTIDSLLKVSIVYKNSNPVRGLEIAQQALYLARDLSYNYGIAEAHRAIGINYTYLNKRDSAINSFLNSLKEYKKTNNEEGVAKAYNNLGNSYGQYNNDKALEFYKNSLNIAIKQGIKNLIAATNLNIGVVYFRMGEYDNSIYYYHKAMPIFFELKDKNGIMLCYQNIGVSKYYLKEYQEGEENLLKAYQIAQEEGLKNAVSSINLTLARLKIATKEFKQAEQYIQEGIQLADELYDEKLLYDFSLTSYELEKKRGNFQQALAHLERVHSRDSLYYRENVANILTLNEEQQKNMEKQKEYEIQIEKQEKHLILLIFSIIVLVLCVLVILLLIKSKKKAEKNNLKLRKLNAEISKQKENLDQINANLEDIIRERTKDLINKNQKLSEYSSHLSHQIRGPVTTLKGLIMLAEDDLIEEKECIQQMGKCIDDIDNKIMNINIALHDPARQGLKNED